MNTFQPQYIRYSRRLLQGIAGIIMIYALLALIFFIFYSRSLEVTMIISFISLILVIPVIVSIEKSRFYLNRISFDEQKCIIEIYEFDKPKETITRNLSDVDFEIRNTIIPGIQVWRNKSLIIKFREGNTFVTYYQQYETGKWNTEIFNSVVTHHSDKACAISIIRRHFSIAEIVFQIKRRAGMSPKTV